MHSKRRVLRLFAVAFVMALSLTPLFSQTAHAAPIAGTIQGEWVNQATIKMNTIAFTEADRDEYINDSLDDLSIEQINAYISNQALGDYRDGNIGDGDHVYTRDNGDCDSKIADGNNGVKELQAVKILVPGKGCQDVIDGWDITLSQSNLSNPLLPGNGNYAQIWFRWVSQNTVTRVDGREGQFMANDPLQPSHFFRLEEAGEGDQDFVVIGANDAYHGMYHVDGDPSNVGLENVQARSTPPTTPPDDLDNPDSAAPDNSCEAHGGALAWILCSVIAALDGGISYIDNQIESLLKFDTNNFADSGVVDSAARVRNLAYFILIPIMLVMVISTALGFEFISAYTVKKALPRLVLATIFIALSSQLLFFLVDLTNVVGNGISGLVLGGLLNNSSGTLQSILNPGQAAGTTVLFAAVGAGAAIVIGPAIIGILLSYALVAFVVLFLAFAILAVRQVLILVLVILAPLAILAWIFPGNDKLWKAWWGTFSKLLLMYPLIIILITAGKVFATFVHGVQGEPLSTLITITAYIAPYFFIPATFKWAGGVFGAVTGMVNDRGKGLFDRQKAFRAKTASEGYRDFKTGATGTGVRGFTSRNVGQRIGVGAKGRFGLGSQEKFRQARDQLERKAMIENVMKGPAWDAVNNNDDALMAATYANAAQAKSALTARFGGDTARADRAVKAIQTSIGFGRPQAIASAQQLVSTGTGYDGIKEMTSTLARASGGNVNTARALAGFANAETKKVGRFDLAPSYGTLEKAVRADGGMLDVGESGPSQAELSQNAWNSASLYQHATAKPTSLKAAIKHHGSLLTSDDQNDRNRAAVFFEELKAMQPNAIGENSEIINAALGRSDALPSDQRPKGVSSYGSALEVHHAQNGGAVSTEAARTRARVYERPDPNVIT